MHYRLFLHKWYLYQEMIKKYLKPYLSLESKKGELANQLYKEVMKVSPTRRT